MPRGGKRSGAGRKKGAATKKTRATADRIAEDPRPKPLDVMVAVMRELFASRVRKDRVAAASIAANAAPYLHSRLQSITLGGKDGGPIPIPVTIIEVRLPARIPGDGPPPLQVEATCPPSSI